MTTTERAGERTAATGVKIPDNPTNIHKADGRLSVPARAGGEITGLDRRRWIINRLRRVKKTAIATMMRK
jgi:hypothetical protein